MGSPPGYTSFDNFMTATWASLTFAAENIGKG
jgi:hypothetical protein